MRSFQLASFGRKHTTLRLETLEDRRTPASNPYFVTPTVPDQSVNLNSTMQNIAFKVKDDDAGQTDSLVVTATSSDQTLLPDANILLTGSGGDWNVKLQPAAGRTGRATVTLRVRDITNRQASDSVILTIRGFANDAPLPGSTAITSLFKDTNYPLPTAAQSPGGIFFVAPAVSTVTGIPAGSAANTGLTPDSPWTVDKAFDTLAAIPSAQRAKTVTLIFRGGEYRGVSRSSPYNMAITLQAFPREKPVLNGALPVTDWTSDGAGHWFASSTPGNGVSFEFPNTQVDKFVDLSWNPFAGNLEQVLFTNASGVSDPKWQVGLYRTTQTGTDVKFYRLADNVLLATRSGDGTLTYNPDLTGAQAAYQEATDPANNTALLDQGKFFVDYVNRRIYVGQDPASVAKVELTAYKVGLRLAGNTTVPVAVRGLNFTGYAETGLQASGDRVEARDNTFAWNRLTGLAFGGARAGTIIADNAFVANGHKGLTSGEGDGAIVSGNLITFNNTRRSSTGWDAAGYKLGNARNFLIRDNIVENNYASGIWLDVNPKGNMVVRNQVNFNTNGIFVEIGTNNAVAFNLLHDNVVGTIIMDSSNTRVFNNTILLNRSSIELRDGERAGEPTAADARNGGGLTWDVYDTVIANNILGESAPYNGIINAAGTKPTAIRGLRTGKELWLPRTTATMLSYLDHNLYHDTTTGTPAQRLILWDPTDDGATGTDFATSLSQFPSGHEKKGKVADPQFTGIGGTDRDKYRPKAGSPALVPGAPVPADILAAVGWTGAQPRFLGAVEPAGMANRAPVISAIANTITLKDTPTATMPFTVGDWTTAVTSLTLKATSSNPKLVPVANIAFSGTGASRGITLTPAPGLTGSAVITVTVSDGKFLARRSFIVAVRPALAVTDVSINDGTVQRSLLNKVTVTFGGVANISAGAFVIKRSAATGGGETIANFTTALVNGQTVATLTFASSADLTVLNGSLPDGRYSLTIDARKVLDVTGRQMNSATDYVRSAGIHRLFGDLNGDRLVTLPDKNSFNKAKNTDSSVWGQGYVSFLDFNADGLVNDTDLAEFNKRLGKKI